jgi:hypothetical protein
MEVKEKTPKPYSGTTSQQEVADTDLDFVI